MYSIQYTQDKGTNKGLTKKNKVTNKGDIIMDQTRGKKDSVNV